VFVDRESGDPKHTAASTTLAREELGYEPKVGLEEGLRQQVEWMATELNRTA
jgi:nucleoside-diphosphate-sugar epimerase